MEGAKHVLRCFIWT